AITETADLFKALATPSRLKMLLVLTHGEATVTHIVDSTGLSTAGVPAPEVPPRPPPRRGQSDRPRSVLLTQGRPRRPHHPRCHRPHDRGPRALTSPRRPAGANHSVSARPVPVRCLRLSAGGSGSEPPDLRRRPTRSRRPALPPPIGPAAAVHRR